MNAASISSSALVYVESAADNTTGSDSDTNTDEAPEYYQPISAVDDDDHGEEDSGQSNPDEEQHENHVANFGNLENGYCTREAESEISSLHLNGCPEQKTNDENEAAEEEEDEERMREAYNSAIVRAFREDDNRRNAPLTPENTTRVMEAMRGISFGGSAPDWAGRIPETQWIDQLRRLRQLPQPSGSVGNYEFGDCNI